MSGDAGVDDGAHALGVIDKHHFQIERLFLSFDIRGCKIHAFENGRSSMTMCVFLQVKVSSGEFDSF